MGFFATIISIVIAFNLGWITIIAVLLQGSRWRRFAVLFGLVQLAGLGWLLAGRILENGWDKYLPKFAVTDLLLWHMLVLPVTSILLSLTALAALIISIVRRLRPEPSSRASVPDDAILSRRQFIGYAAAALPPLATVSLGTVAMRQLHDFRVNRITLELPNLPPDLHGITIAQVSDMHVGRFTSGRVLDRIVSETNNLQADLVLLTGDLINDSLGYLDPAIDLVRKMHGRFGVYVIEGNHDLIENPSEFETRMSGSGIPFLLDQSAILQLRGQPVQLLGLSWTRSRHNRDQAISQAVRSLIGQRQPEAFSILLAHHPHAFDPAAEANIPLTLSGHTHGGQLMLNQQCGFGPAFFRYWSGVYGRADSKLVVSNGVGNWFPLRINAPAEIVHLTLVKT